MGEVEDASLELQTDEEKDTAVHDEGDVKVFVEGESDSSGDYRKNPRTEKVMMSKTDRQTDRQMDRQTDIFFLVTKNKKTKNGK